MIYEKYDIVHCGVSGGKDSQDDYPTCATSSGACE